MALTDNIRAYWKLDESSGNATDSSGNGLTLTNTTSKSYTTGLINNCIDFGSSVRNTTEMTNNSTLTWNTSVSISLWFKMNSALSGSNVDPGLFILPYRNASGSANALIPQWNGGSPRIAYIRRAGADATASTSFGNDTTTWHHLVAVYDSSATAIYGYLDGTAFSTTGVASSGSFNASAYPMSLGGSYMSNNATALVDEVGVWQRALSSTEVTELYNGGAGLAYPFSGGAIKRSSLMLGGYGT